MSDNPATPPLKETAQAGSGAAPCSALDEIPREHLIEMLKESAWYSGERAEFKAQGFSFDVKEETALRDVNYRNEPLYETGDDAIVAHWMRHFANKDRDQRRRATEQPNATAAAPRRPLE